MRHGEVENPQTLRYGRLPGYHLSEAGRQQVEQASLFFLKRPIAHIYTSPLERTQQTATILGITLPHVPITLDGRILEVKTAEKFEGKSRDRDFYYSHKSSSDAETMQDIIDRMYHFVEEVVTQQHGRESIVVSHGDPLAMLFHWLMYKEVPDTWRVYPSYASVTTYVFDGLKCRQAWYRPVVADAGI